MGDAGDGERGCGVGQFDITAGGVGGVETGHGVGSVQRSSSRGHGRERGSGDDTGLGQCVASREIDRAGRRNRNDIDRVGIAIADRPCGVRQARRIERTQINVDKIIPGIVDGDRRASVVIGTNQQRIATDRPCYRQRPASFKRDVAQGFNRHNVEGIHIAIREIAVRGCGVRRVARAHRQVEDIVGWVLQGNRVTGGCVNQRNRSQVARGDRSGLGDRPACGKVECTAGCNRPYPHSNRAHGADHQGVGVPEIDSAAGALNVAR